MKCEEVKNKLMDYLFGELEDKENKQINAHFQTCQTCELEWTELQSTVHVLKKWPEITPKRDIVFVAPNTSLIERAGQFFQSDPKKSRLHWVGRLAFVGLIFVVIFMRSEVQYSQGQFSLRIGSKNNQATQLNHISPEIVSALRNLQEENLMYTQQMVRASEQRQQNLLLTGLSQISDKIDQTRKVDLNYVGENLQRLERNNLYNFDKTNAILEDLVKVTATGYPIKK